MLGICRILTTKRKIWLLSKVCYTKTLSSHFPKICIFIDGTYKKWNNWKVNFLWVTMDCCLLINFEFVYGVSVCFNYFYLYDVALMELCCRWGCWGWTALGCCRISNTATFKTYIIWLYLWPRNYKKRLYYNYDYYYYK